MCFYPTWISFQKAIGQRPPSFWWQAYVDTIWGKPHKGNSEMGIGCQALNVGWCRRARTIKSGLCRSINQQHAATWWKGSRDEESSVKSTLSEMSSSKSTMEIEFQSDMCEPQVATNMFDSSDRYSKFTHQFHNPWIRPDFMDLVNSARYFNHRI